MPNDDLVTFCAPDWNKCSAAVGDLMPAATEAIEYFVSMKWLSAEPDGSKAFHQDPVCAFWTNIPLSVGVCFVPCCGNAVHARKLEKFAGSSYESECLKMIVLSCCCYLYACYYPKRRGQFRAKFGLRGSPLEDCLTSCCFGGCMNCQEAVELEHSAGFKVPYCNLEDAAKLSGGAAKTHPTSDPSKGGNK